MLSYELDRLCHLDIDLGSNSDIWDRPMRVGDVVQLDRALACRVRGYGFESRLRY